jgi:hypothetical protein
MKASYMKNKILLTTIGVAVLATFTLSASAYDLALSPRAKDNQIKVVLGYTAAQPAQPAPATGVALSPRAAANQTPTVASVANDVNPTLQCRNMTASPKAIAACQANPAMPGCRATATASAAP